MPRYILAFGANCNGAFGDPRQSLPAALANLELQGWSVKAVSRLYSTAPQSHLRQRKYINCAALVDVALPPSRVLRVLKALERSAGRVQVRSHGERPLDIDIIDAGGRSIGWPDRQAAAVPRRRGLSAEKPGNMPRRSARPGVVVPHPLAHVRAFVLDPVADIAPHWWHRGLRQPMQRLRYRLVRPPGSIKILENGP